MNRFLVLGFVGATMLSGVARSQGLDLDGDGRFDQVHFECDSTAQHPQRYVLTINGVSTSGMGEGLHRDYLVVDVDSTDAIREIAVQEDGPSDDYLTTLYILDHGSIREIGRIPGTYDLRIDGSGVIQTKARGSILQTWFYSAAFVLDARHNVKQVTQPIYPMGTRCRVKRGFALQASPSDSTIVAHAFPGDTVTIVASDDRHWCLVQIPQGLWGWFEVVRGDIVLPANLRASELLDGLSYAD